MRRFLRRLARPLPALFLVSALALAVRLYDLGHRVAHQDEARVADWILQYMAMGTWEYRPIIHGPFLPHANGVLFDLLGPSDFAMRLLPAVAGALLPLAALLYRTRLRDGETIALGLLLAANPLLLYYSRFMRNDLLLAAVMFAAVGCFVRAWDTKRLRWLPVAALLFGLGFTMKENALLYPVAWVGALALVADSRVVTGDRGWVGRAVAGARRVYRWLLGLVDVLAGGPRDPGHGLAAHVRDGLRAARRNPVVRYVPLALLLLAEALVVAVLFYAPKPDLYTALSGGRPLLPVLREATVGVWFEFLGTWGGASMHSHSMVAFLGQLLEITIVGAPSLLPLAVVGFVADRYAGDSPRDLVAFCAYWGFASIFGYAAITDIMAGWTAIHAVVPLAVPAAVALAALYRMGREAFATDRPSLAAGVVAALALSALVTGGVAAGASFAYDQSTENPLVQYAQPAGDMKPVLHDIREVSQSNDGVDVLFYGDEFHNPTGSQAFTIDDWDVPGDAGGAYPGWFARLPLPWYLDQYDANVSSVQSVAAFPDSPPPVVVTLDRESDDIDDRLDGYARYTFPRYLTSGHGDLAIYVRTDA
ncbi:flippase activity-associated protein Agl23 [Salarchaeum sp. JOR-1]|uniref:flippase activity-associated protein Agl23 n=1 Tax=Salarchaeum sp. JOR-1 TaxID=2599399 RepID=UPI001198331B|nr:flippase activity-associated protein Agl23 [Salarchaeum sp. JOR-1]QDX40447.1 TIGR03663 family protein [Salarchaeum sp. JOR-1]